MLDYVINVWEIMISEDFFYVYVIVVKSDGIIEDEFLVISSDESVVSVE